VDKTRDIGCLYGITHTCQVLKRQMNRLEVLSHAVPHCALQFNKLEVSTGLLNEAVDAGVQSGGDSRLHRNRPYHSGTVSCSQVDIFTKFAVHPYVSLTARCVVACP